MNHVHEWETQNVCETCGARESAPLDGLTVERLARAVASAGVHIDVRDPLTRTEPCDSCARGVRVIASEYVALRDEGEPT